MSRLMLVILVSLIFMYACGSSDGGDRGETSGLLGKKPGPKRDDLAEPQKDITSETEPEAERSPRRLISGHIEMPRPGVISRYDKIVRKYSRRYLFDWRLISAQIYTESRFRAGARSYRGALGLMQIMPGTARWLEEKAGDKVSELKGVSQMLLKPELNIHLGCYYDAMLLSRIKNAKTSEDRHKMMFAAYNAGPGNLNRARRKSDAPQIWQGIKEHLPMETRKYVPKIYNKYAVYKQWAALSPY